MRTKQYIVVQALAIFLNGIKIFSISNTTILSIQKNPLS